MTLVASYSVQKHPVLIGDLMLSYECDGRAYRPFNIPSHDDVNYKNSDATGYLICGLTQKVNMVTNNLAAAWAGTLRDATDVLVQLQNEAIKPNFSTSELCTFFNEQSLRSDLNLYITGILVEKGEGGSNKIVRFAWDSDTGWNSPIFESSLFKECYIGGSGSDDLRNVFSTYIPDFPKSSREMNPLEMSLSMTFSAVGVLIGDQMRCSKGLCDLYGGGFELVTFMNGRLKKFSDVTYHFWDVVLEDSDNLTITLHSALKLSYKDDLLIIRKLEPVFDENKEQSEDRSQNQLWVIPSIYCELSEADKTNIEKTITWPHLNSRFSVFYINRPQVPSNRRISTLIHQSSSDEPAVKYVESSEGIKVGITDELLRRLRSSIQKTL